jgi:Protein of unknown function (DUF1569)
MSIYNTTDYQAMLQRLEKLSPDSQALWGKMNPAQMLEHCHRAALVAFGEQELKINFLMRLLGKMLKNKFINTDAPLQKNAPTAKEFVISTPQDFEQAKQKLTATFARFAQGPESIKQFNHPFWGKLSLEEWDRLMTKHLNHHFEQFGI